MYAPPPPPINPILDWTLLSDQEYLEEIDDYDQVSDEDNYTDDDDDDEDVDDVDSFEVEINDIIRVVVQTKVSL